MSWPIIMTIMDTPIPVIMITGPATGGRSPSLSA